MLLLPLPPPLLYSMEKVSHNFYVHIYSFMLAKMR
jgi:hypothetical protein